MNTIKFIRYIFIELHGMNFAFKLRKCIFEAMTFEALRSKKIPELKFSRDFSGTCCSLTAHSKLFLFSCKSWVKFKNRGVKLHRSSLINKVVTCEEKWLYFNNP